MKLPYQYQPAEIDAIRERIKAHGLTYEQIAKKMNRKPGGIAQALVGNRMTLLGRIDRFLKKLDTLKKGTKSTRHMAA